jgi:hypothetical protein
VPAQTDLRASAVGHGTVAGFMHACGEVAEEGSSSYCCEPAFSVYGEVLEVFEVDYDCSIDASETCLL